MTRRTSAARAYAALLFLFPPAFRRDFGPSMAEDFADLGRDAAAKGGTALARYWLRAAADLLVSIPRQWARRPGTWASAGALAGATICLQVVRLASPDALLDVRAPAGQEEEMLFLVVALTALFPIVAVIMLVWWFPAPGLRPRPRRRRA